MRHLAVVVLVAALAPFVGAGEWRWSGPSGGATRALVAAPSNPRTLYLASAGGLFRSIDGGDTWTNITGPVTYPSFLAVDPNDADVVYAVDDGLDFSSYQMSDTLYRTVDGGRNWVRLSSGLPSSNLDVTGLAVSPHDPHVILVSSRCQPFWSRTIRPDYHEAAGVYRSTDSGSTFQLAIDGMTFFQSCTAGISFDPALPGVVYAAPGYSDNGSARSDDYGATWTKAPTSVPGNEVVIDPRNSRRYGLTSIDSGLLISDDEGAHWSARTPAALDLKGSVYVTGTDSLTIDPVSGRLFIGTSAGAFRSGDGGHSVLSLGGVARGTITDMVFDSANGALTMATSSGVFRSAGFPWNEWRLLDTGDRMLTVTDLAASKRDPEVVYAVAGATFYVTRDNGGTWELYGNVLPPIEGGLPNAKSLAVDDAETLYCVAERYDKYALFKLPRGATEWIELPVRQAPSRVYTSPSSASVLYLLRSGGFLGSSDGGATWRLIDVPVVEGFAFASALGIDPDNPDVLYGGTNGGLLKSTDGGRTWSLKTASNIFVQDIAVSLADKNTIYFWGRNRPEYEELFYRSTDGGETWTEAGALPDEVGLESTLAADPRDARIIYIAGRRVFRSIDRGATWAPFDQGLPQRFGPGPPYSDTRKVVPNATGTILHAASARGIWTRTLSRRRAVAPR